MRLQFVFRGFFQVEICLWCKEGFPCSKAQVPSSMGFSRQEYWSGLPFPSPWKILKETGIPDHLRNLYVGQETTVRTGHGTTDWFKIGNRVWHVVYFHPTYFISMQSTSCKMLGWINLKLESRLLGEISITLDTQITPHLWQKGKRN